MVLAEVLLDHLHAHIARSPLLTVKLDSPQPFQIRQMLAQLVRRKPLLLMPRIDLAQPPRNLTRTPRSLTNPNNLNIHLGRRQYPKISSSDILGFVRPKLVVPDTCVGPTFGPFR